MADVVLLAEIKADNRLATPLQILEMAAQDIRSGTEKATACLVILLDSDGSGPYRTMGYRANLSNSQAIALCEIRKQAMIQDLL